MTRTIKPAILAIVFLASPLSLATDSASAAGHCLTAPGKPGPAGSRWYYRLEHPSLRKCWHLVLKGGKRPAVAAAPQPAADDDEAATATVPTPVPAKPAEQLAEPVKPAPEPVIRTLVTRNASNPGTVVPAPDQSFRTAAADDSQNAPAPAEQATEPAPAPVVAVPQPLAAVPQPLAAARAPVTAASGGTSILNWLLAAVALLGAVACAAFFAAEMRRRRTDVLNNVGDDEVLPPDASADESGPLLDPTFEPLPAMRAPPLEDDVDRALRRFARRRAA